MPQSRLPDYVNEAKNIQSIGKNIPTSASDIELAETLFHKKPEFYPDSVRQSLGRIQFFKRIGHQHLKRLSDKMIIESDSRIVEAGDKKFSWRYIPERVRANGTIIAAGAGSNISYEMHMAKNLPNTKIYLLDPSPRSTELFQYSELPANIHYVPIGLAGSDGVLKFFKPTNPGAGSLSAMHLNPGDAYL